MLYDTGDTHANQEKWLTEIHPVLKPGDIIIVNGDYGIGFWDGPYWPEEMFYDWIGEQKYIVLFCDGNHENFDKLYEYPVVSWNGGKVHKLRHNLMHLMRGEVYNIDGNTIFTFGGGYSLDKYRRKEGISWWPQEMPSEEEYHNAEANLERVGYKVDYVVTHTAPSESVYYLSKLQSLGIKGNVIEEMQLTAFLDNIQKRLSYRHWFFGHFHTDLDIWRNQTAVLSSIRELETGKLIKRWENYEV